MNKILSIVSELLEEAGVGPVTKDIHSAERINVALEIYGAIRRLKPNLMEGYVEAIRVLKRHSRREEAANLIAEALQRFPRALWALSEAVGLSIDQKDYTAALTHSEQLRSTFPRHRAGYVTGAQVLRLTGRFEEADTLVGDAAELFPDDAWPLFEAVRVSQDRADWPSVVQRCAELRRRQPDASGGYIMACNALRNLARFTEAADLMQLAHAHFPDEAWPRVQLAWFAHERNDPEEALRLWSDIRAAFPDNLDSYLAAGRTYLALSRLDEAETMFRAAVERFPEQKGPALEFAHVAEIKGCFDEADNRWEALAKAFPNDPQIAVQHAAAPASPRRSDFSKNWSEAFARFARLNAAFPEFGPGYAGHINTLRRAGRLQEAEAVALSARRTLPRDVDVALETAKVLELSRKPADAVVQLEAIAAVLPKDRRIEAALATSLSLAGRYDDADAVCVGALERSEEPEMLKVYAQNATRRGDAAAASERWRVAERSAPTNLALRSEAAAARFTLSSHEAPIAGDVGADDEGGVADGSLSQMIAQFESLGGTAQGCEFGLVQRKLGAEPIGLLRWTAMTLATLLDALRSRFENVGEAEQTQLDLYNHLNGEQEYRTSDRRFMMSMHTFIKPDMIPFDRMFTQSCRRLRFLKARLLEDLEAANKVFVFKTGDRCHSVEEVSELLRALRTYGGNTLLYVRLADECHLSGSVHYAADDLLIGYLDHFSQIPGGAARLPNYVDWTRLCSEAHRLWRNQQERRHA